MTNSKRTPIEKHVRVTMTKEQVVPIKRKRPKKVQSTTERIECGCGHLYVTIGKDGEGKIVEVFAVLGKAGGCAMAQNEALTRTISLGLKYGIPVREFVDELDNIRCSAFGLESGEPILSCADAIAYVLNRENEGKVSDKET